ncbi:MAG TPA: hypothetical protein VGV13_15565 [Methylomirabilota bacterium]|nr:hypothetical protein [Methylomirabilota bacterium]
MTIVRLTLMLLAAGLAVGCTVARGSRPDDPGVIGAVITYIDVYDGYMVVEWPGGRSTISMDRRALYQYRIGDDVALDSALRPIPRR